MKRTLLITLEYPPQIGGVAHYYQQLVEHLPPDNIQVLDNHSGQLLFGSRWIWPRWLKAIWSTWRVLRRNDIHHLLVGQLLPLGTVALILHRLTGISYTVMTHGMDVTLPFGPTGNARRRWLVRAILRSADSITTVSSYTQHQLEAIGVPAHQITLLHPCPYITPAITPATIHCRPDVPVILSVGRLVQRKGFDTLLQAHQLLLKKIPKAVCVIAGAGEQLASLEQLAADLGISGQVVFTGRVTDQALAAWYERCTVFAMLPRELANHDVEGFGIIFLEAASFSKPVVAARSGGVADAVIDGVTGTLVDPDSPAAAADAIYTLLTQPERAQQYGQAGQQRVATEFQWSQQAKKLENLL